MTQVDRVLRHLKDSNSITSYEAFVDYGITRLSAVIYVLRHDYNLCIDDVWISKENRYGELVKFKQYFLVRG